MTIPPTINVLFMASEADPLVKVGGLADVAGSLPPALRTVSSSLGKNAPLLDVRLVIPYHPGLRIDRDTLQKVVDYKIHTTSGDIPVTVFGFELDGLPVYLISGPPIEQSAGVYSANLVADGYKYVFFSQAALSLPKHLGWKLDILHANDWHTSAAVYSLALNKLTDPFFRQTASVLTVHNLPYLGAMTSPALAAFELPPAEHTSLPAWANHMALPLGLLTADAIVAVSPGYSHEIMTEEFGSGLHIFLKVQSNKISGILNGLDINRWNPATDSDLAARYTAVNIQARLDNKALLQAELNLETNPALTLLAMVTRMDPQKGVNLAVNAIRMLLSAPRDDIPTFQVVFLGTGDPVLEQSVCSLEADYPNLVRAKITYNERLSRHIYSGADILLMPSLYEPCGLAQMIAMHYGCLPVAHATGGLSDTIDDPSQTNNSTGFLFKPAQLEALVGAIHRAIALYQNSPDDWREMQIRAMLRNFSWNRSAQEYIKLYCKLLDSK